MKVQAIRIFFTKKEYGFILIALLDESYFHKWYATIPVHVGVRSMAYEVAGFYPLK